LLERKLEKSEKEKLEQQNKIDNMKEHIERMQELLRINNIKKTED